MDNEALFGHIRRGEWSAVEPFFRDHPELVDTKYLKAFEPDSRVHDESTPIHCAAKHGQLAIVKELVALGAEVYSNLMSSYPAVMQAAWAGKQDVVDYFLKEIPHLAAGTRGLGVMINLAGRMGWFDLVRRHVEIDPLAVHQRGWIGDTPLHWPAHNGFIEIVRFLLDHGADPNAHEIGCYGGTPLHWAAERHVDIVLLLLERGARINEQDVFQDSHLAGTTPLIWCCRQTDDSGEVVTTLLQRGADPAIKDATGKTGLQWARELGNQNILSAFEAAGMA